MKTETKPYNPVDFLQNDSEIVDYLNDAFMDEDPDLFIIALGHVAKHKGIAQLAAGKGWQVRINEALKDWLKDHAA
jgi:probable addiction module antidote protein